MRTITKSNFASELGSKDIDTLDRWYDMAVNMSNILNVQEVAAANAFVDGEITDRQRMSRIKAAEDIRRVLLRIEQDVLTVKDLLGGNTERETLGLTLDHVSDRVFADITVMLDPMTKIQFDVPEFNDDAE